jgi:hypothetical protein
MSALFSRIRQHYTPGEAVVEQPEETDEIYEQYRTSNIRMVFHELYPADDATSEQKDALASRRREVAKLTTGLVQGKKSFTAANEKAAIETQKAGIKTRDWADWATIIRS